ncbi:MAG: hypothetical protein U0176_23390 [Bacteroidia bacterium]
MNSILVSNDVFDATYSGVAGGNIKGAVISRATIVESGDSCAAVTISVPEGVAEAWKAFADNPIAYDGAAHVAAGYGAAKAGKAIAFDLICTGIAIRARSGRSYEQEELECLFELAKEGNWTFAESHLRWLSFHQ